MVWWKIRFYPWLMIISLTCFAGISKSLPGQDTIPGSQVIIGDLTFEGNKITRERIIRRELLFGENDTISYEKLPFVLDQSRKNLMNTSLFNFVTITQHPDSLSGKTDIHIDFLERWYVWPVPIIEFADRNFNEWLKKKDWSRLNYGGFLTWNNFRGRREKLNLYARFGYDEKYQLGYQIPYLNRKQTIGIGIAGGFSQNHEIAYNSFETVERQNVVDGDTTTYYEQIGNKEVYYKNDTRHVRREIYAYAEMYYQREIHNKQWFKIQFSELKVNDTVLVLNPDYMFGNSNANRYFTFYYQFRSDYRDYRQYPLNGYYFDASLDKKGLGVFDDPVVNSLSIKANYRTYQHLKGGLYWASGITGKTSPFWDQPYYFIEGLGYGRDFVRGYEYYVIDGRHFGVVKNNLKFELVGQRVQEFKFIPTDKFNKLYYAFYLNAYVDLGYTVDPRNQVYNPLADQLLVGYGIGLDFVTYYDFVLRVEYSFNKMGESGFFIHFMPSI
ncbi:MAG: hypothetical protein KDC05_03195 [Bacteroidales bacterium]|nr:hypothetical protein [Bacteroidales bacterium]